MESSERVVKRRKWLSISDKAEMIAQLERGVPNARVGETYGITSSTVSKIWKCREKIMATLADNGGRIKKMRPCKNGHVDKALYQWYKEQLNIDPNVYINGPTLKAQAESIANQLGDMNFKCSNGWLHSFKIRHNLVFSKSDSSQVSRVYRRTGVDTSTRVPIKPLVLDYASDMSDWIRNVWANFSDQFEPKDIFSLTEIGLLYNLMPDEFGNFRGETCESGNLANSRVSLIMATNMSGCEKRPLVVIGRTDGQKCFGNHPRNLGVRYETNDKSWITAEIASGVMRDWDVELRQCNRHVLVLFGNSPVHRHIDDLTNITCLYFPQNLIRMLQPMNHGIVKSFKYLYRKGMVMKYLDRQDGPKCEERKVTILEAVRLMVESWSILSTDLIQACFRKSGLCMTGGKSANEYSSAVHSLPSDWLSESNIYLNLPDVEDYVGFDEKLVVTRNTDDLVEEMSEDNTSHDDYGDNEEDYCVNTLTSSSEALAALEVLRNFYETNSVDSEFYKHFLELKNIVDSYHIESRINR